MKLALIAQWAAWLGALLCMPQAGWARDHVLVMTVSNYEGPNRLPGARFDADHAQTIARELGFDLSAARVLKDSELTAAGLRAAIKRLSTDVLQNDRVFVYFSGHGGTQLQPGGHRVTGLLGQDMGFVGLNELRTQLENIKQRTSKVWVLFDTCFSGGLQDVAVHRAAPAGFSLTAEVDRSRTGIKSVDQEGGTPGPASAQAQFWLSGFPLEPAAGSTGTRLALMPESNFTFLAAARQTEKALDDDQRGGLATVNLLACLRAGVPDLDGSGQVSASEWVQCAQGRIREEMPAFNARRGTQHAAQNLQIFGNTDSALPSVPRVEVPLCSAADKSVGRGSGGDTAPSLDAPAAMPAPASPPPAPATLPTPSTATPTATSAATAPSGANNTAAAPCRPASGPESKVQSELARRTLSAFRQIAAGSNGNWSAAFDMPRRVRMGQEAEVHVRTAQVGYLTVLYMGSDGKDVRMWVANAPLPATPGRALARTRITDCKGGCAGINTYLFVLSAQPLDVQQFTEAERTGHAVLSSRTISRLHCMVDPAAASADRACQRNADSFKLLDGAAVHGYVAQVLDVEGY